MYERLTPRWASTAIGCFSLFMVPLPFLLTRCALIFPSRTTIVDERANAIGTAQRYERSHASLRLCTSNRRPQLALCDFDSVILAC